MPWTTILVPHDLSTCAEHAAELARSIAKVHRARIVLLHVASLPFGLDPDALVVRQDGTTPQRIEDLAASGALGYLEQLAERLRADGLDVATEIRFGDVVDEILGVANRTRADLIVMGTHGRTGLSHLVVGSVTESVVRRSTVPVLTTRELPPESRRTSG